MADDGDEDPQVNLRLLIPLVRFGRILPPPPRLPLLKAPLRAEPSKSHVTKKEVRLVEKGGMPEVQVVRVVSKARKRARRGKAFRMKALGLRGRGLVAEAMKRLQRRRSWGSDGSPKLKPNAGKRLSQILRGEKKTVLKT